MKRIASVIMAFTMMLSGVGLNVAAETTTTTEGMVEVQGYQDATIVQVLDGDELLVRLANSDQALVKLIGTENNGNEAAFDYAYENYSGLTVFLVQDSTIPSYVDGWNYLYAYSGNTLLNADLIKQGQCDFNEEHKGCDTAAALSSALTYAKNYKMGIWDDGYASGREAVDTSGITYININSATIDQLKSMLTGVSRELAAKIVTYRKTAPFREVSDILYVEGMTQEIYNKNKNKMHTITNLKTATLKELNTLDITSEGAGKIYQYNKTYGINYIEEIYEFDLITEVQYRNNKYFITLNDQEYNNYAVPNFAVNINTATITQLVAAGLTQSQASTIITQRKSMPLNTLNDLASIDVMEFTDAKTIESYSDNLYCYTDINTASEYELASLFGSTTNTSAVKAIIENRPYESIKELKQYIPSAYSQISAYIYAGEVDTAYCNINTASYDQLIAYGYGESMAKALYAKHLSMKSPSEVAFPLGAKKTTSSLYTNINTASVRELLTLSEDIDLKTATQITIYRTSTTFTTKTQIANYFKNIGLGEAYESFADFVVCR